MSPEKFIDEVNKNCKYNEISDEIFIKFIANIYDVTISQYMTLPRSMLIRKFEMLFIININSRNEFDYHFLPICFRSLQ